MNKNDYQMAYRALRRWNKASWRGYNRRDTIEMFKNIRDAYPRPIFDAALISLMESNAYKIYHN